MEDIKESTIESYKKWIAYLEEIINTLWEQLKNDLEPLPDISPSKDKDEGPSGPSSGDKRQSIGEIKIDFQNA